MEYRFREMSPGEAEPNDDAVIVAEERRKYSRTRRVMRVARLHNNDLELEGLGLVRDVSPGGMMIDALFPVRLGQLITISLIDDQFVTGQVIWKADDTIGVKFRKEVDVEHILAKPALNKVGLRTRLPRLVIDRKACVQADSTLFSATICNVSQRGAKIRCEHKIKLNTDILIIPGERRTVRGTVRWSTVDLHGIEFHRTLSIDELITWLPGADQIVLAV